MSALGHVVEPRCGVDAVADHRVVEAVARAEIAHHDLAGIEPHPDGEDLAALRAPVAHHVDDPLLLLPGAPHGAVGIVRQRIGRRENRHHAIADELVDVPDV